MISYSFYHRDSRVRRHVSGLVADGWNVDLISLNYSGPTPDLSHPNVRFFYPRARVFGRSALRILYEYLVFAIVCAFILTRNHFLHHRYRVIHVNNMPNFLVFSALGLRLLGVPVILDVHDTMPEIYEDDFGGRMRSLVVRCLLLEERISMRLSDYVIAATHTEWERLHVNGMRKERSDVVLNVPDPDLWPDREPSPGARQEGFRLVYHGTLAWRLGLDIAVKACAMARDRVPGLRFDIIGDGDQKSALVGLVRELGLEDTVHFSDGFVSVEQLPSMIADAELAVLPSRNSSATRYMLPVKLLEYIRFGIPCAVVPTPTIKHYFRDSMVRFFEPEDPSALAAAIVDLYGKPEERVRMAVEAKEFTANNSFEDVRARYQTIVSALAERGRRRAERSAGGTRL